MEHGLASHQPTASGHMLLNPEFRNFDVPLQHLKCKKKKRKDVSELQAAKARFETAECNKT